MDPIEIALKMKLDDKSLDDSIARVEQKTSGMNTSGMSAGQIGKELEAKAASVISDVAKASKAMGGNVLGKSGGSGAFWEKNKHLLQTVGDASGEGAGGGSAKSLLANALGAEDKAKKAANAVMRDKATFMKDMTFLMMPLMNPGSIWATLFSTRQVFSALSTTKMGKGMVGGTLGGAAMGTAAMVGGATALGVVFTALKKVIEGTIEAYGNARREYAKALMSGGLPLNFTVRRGALASVLGVSEKEVFQFGRQIAWLNDRLKASNQAVAYNVPLLTAANTQWEVMKKNLSGIFSNTAFMVAPMLNRLGAAINGLLEKWLTSMEEQKAASIKAWEAEKVVLLEKKRKNEEILANSKNTSFWGVANAKRELAGINAKLAAHTSAPGAQSYMRQLGASSWERMGLVIGGMGGANPAVETARNTRATVTELKGLRKAFLPRSANHEFFNPAASNP